MDSFLGMKPEILLKAYVLHESEAAFRELVAVSLDEVYSTAFRIVKGVSPLAEETALRVYWELARKAPKLVEEVDFASWFREHTCQTAAIVLREDGRIPDRLILKSEMQETFIPDSIQPAPRGLATRVCQGVLLNVARRKDFRRLLIPTLPVWVRPRQIRVTAVCALMVIVLLKVPFHRSHQIIQLPNVQLTPASFAQMGTSEEDDAATLSIWKFPENEIRSEEP